MKNQQRYDFFPQKARYLETLDEVELSRQLYKNTYEEVLLGEGEEEARKEPQESAFFESFLLKAIPLVERFQKGNWGKVSVICIFLLAFSMLYSGDRKETDNSSLLLRAYASEKPKKDEVKKELTDEELEQARIQEEEAAKEINKVKEDAEIVKSLQLLKELKLREEALQQREEELRVKEDQVKTIEEGLNTRIVEMDKLKAELEELVTLRKDLGEKSIRQLVKVYENMQPQEAASVLEKLDEDISVQVLLRLKGKKAGKILNVMKPAISVRLSEEIARRK